MSNSLAVKYQPLSQSAPSDDEDEGFHDNVLYDSRLVVGPDMDHRNVFELEKLGQPRVRSPAGIQSLSRGRRLCLLALVLVLIVFGVLVAVLFPILSHKYNHGIVTAVHTGKTSPDWMLLFNSTLTHAVVRLLDADEDGLDDILIGLTIQAGTNSLIDEFAAVTECCSSPADSTYTHGGLVVALRGYDGTELWRATTRSVTLDLSCADVDVSGDGRVDCIITGHDSALQAIDVLTGTTLWSIDADSPKWSSHFSPGWDVDGLVTVSDLDLDGVLDMVISLSGHYKKYTLKQEQKMTRLILVSGKTGLVIGSGFVEFTKQGNATMPPVKLVSPEGGIYILCGSNGDENGLAGLMAISLPDLYQRATGHSLSKLDLSIYGWLHDREKDTNGLTMLFSGQDKDEVLNSLLVETDADGHHDILVSSSGGLVALLDGQTLEERWRRTFPNLGIFSTPVPGHFDTDQVLDFIVQLRTDRCHSQDSQTLVLSGMTGETLWAFKAENHTLSSCLSLETVTSKPSVFVVAMDSVKTSQAPLLTSDLQTTSGVDLSDQEFQDLCRDMGQKFAASHVTCDHELELLTEKVFLLDHIISDRPLKLLERPAYRYSYRLQHTPDSQHCHSLSSQPQDQTDLCTVLAPAPVTGAVSDVDADGFLDYIHISQMTGLNTSDTFRVTGTIGSVIVSKHNIHSAIAKGQFQQINSRPDHSAHQQGAGYHQHVKSWQFSQTNAETVGQYSGSSNDCPFVPT